MLIIVVFSPLSTRRKRNWAGRLLLFILIDWFSTMKWENIWRNLENNLDLELFTGSLTEFQNHLFFLSFLFSWLIVLLSNIYSISMNNAKQCTIYWLFCSFSPFSLEPGSEAIESQNYLFYFGIIFCVFLLHIQESNTCLLSQNKSISKWKKKK